MYTLSSFNRGIRDPHLIFREVNRAYYRLTRSGEFNSRGTDIFDADWDNLIILDACRYDVFRERADDLLPGQLERRTSRAATTSEFVRAHFANRKLHDVVYVTGNSWILKIGDDIGADVFSVVNAKNDRDFDQHWITEEAVQAAEDHPDKRILVHFIPPHHPFVGPTAEEHLPSFEEQASDFFERVRRRELDVPDDLLRIVYAENLDRVLPRVEELLDEFRGKTVVTADHGEHLGDRSSPIPVKEYGHHGGLYSEPLVAVPWHVHVNGDRKDIVEDEPLEDDIDRRSPEEIDHQLRALGYKV